MSDPYVKAIRWASDRINDVGILAFITNNSFVDDIAFDGMRKHLAEDFDEIYILDLGGNVRKNPKLSGTTHNVFGIQLGVSINIFVKKRKYDVDETKPLANIFYANLDTNWRKEQKYEYLEKTKQKSNVPWQLLKPNQKHTWLTEGLENSFDLFLPITSKENTKNTKSSLIYSIFKISSGGVKTNRDTWAYNFNKNELIKNIKHTINAYNEQTYKWINQKIKPANVDNFVSYDDKKISWSRDLKADLKRGRLAEFDENKIRKSVYRPFTKSYLVFDRILNEEVYSFPSIFPRVQTESTNQVICVTQNLQKHGN